MTKRIIWIGLVCMVLASGVTVYAQDKIEVSIVRLEQSYTRDSPVFIEVQVDSFYALEEVNARFVGTSGEDKTVSIEPGWTNWYSNVDLSGWSPGIKQVTVTATDIHGLVGVSPTRTIDYNKGPEIVISGPPEGGVIREDEVVLVYCEECVELVVEVYKYMGILGDPIKTVKGTTELVIVLDSTLLNGFEVLVRTVGRDSQGDMSIESLKLYVETSKMLELYNGETPVLTNCQGWKGRNDLTKLPWSVEVKPPTSEYVQVSWFNANTTLSDTKQADGAGYVREPGEWPVIPGGDCMVMSDGSRYLVGIDKDEIFVNTRLGKAFHGSGKWFVQIDEVVFSVKVGGTTTTTTTTSTTTTSTPTTSTSATTTTLPTIPTVTTNSATYITSTSAILNGRVNPNGSNTEVHFEYGTTTSYGFSTPPEDIGADTSSVTVNASISNLVSDTTYHYRLTATNSEGTSYGADMTFYTAISYVSSDGTCGGNTPCYSTIQEAIDAASSGTTIHIFEGSYNEDVTLYEAKVIILQGGWDSTFTTQSSYTTVKGSMAIGDGKMKLRNVKVQFQK